MASFSITQYHGKYNRVARTTAVKYIVVHYVGNGTSAVGNAKNNCIYFSGGNRQASAHYFIDDGSIYEYADPKTWATWHVGDGRGAYGITNANSIGIEVCNNGGAFTEAEIQRLQWLVLKLMSDFNVPASRVVRHYDASRKQCPIYYVDSARWSALHKRITTASTTKKEVPDMTNDQAKQLAAVHKAVTSNGIASWGYKNREVNGETDAYAILCDMWKLIKAMDSRITTIEKKLG